MKIKAASIKPKWETVFSSGNWRWWMVIWPKMFSEQFWPQHCQEKIIISLKFKTCSYPWPWAGETVLRFIELVSGRSSLSSSIYVQISKISGDVQWGLLLKCFLGCFRWIQLLKRWVWTVLTTFKVISHFPVCLEGLGEACKCCTLNQASLEG